MTIGVKEEEIVSYRIAQYLPIVMTSAVVLTSLLAVLSFLLYNYKAGLNISIICFNIDLYFSFIRGAS